MIKLRKRHYVTTSYWIFLICMAVALALFVFRVFRRSEVTEMTVGQVLLCSKDYAAGTIFDRNGEVIVSGSGDALNWSTERTQEAFQQVLGTDVESTLLSRTTVLGNCTWVLGTDDNRWGLDSLFHPAEERCGGSVKLTLDKELQEYITDLIIQNGYENAYVMVSDYSIGEMLAVYGNVFSKSIHPGSTLKPVLAATALSLYPELEGYTYNCVTDNHNFKIEDGQVKINCAGDASHGKLSMEDAIAFSCNGYFISLMKQCDQKEMLESLKRWGFDTTISYDQFMYWDHSFMKNSDSETDYLMGAIGQANAYITPAGLHFCTSTLLNRGKLVEPVWYTQKKNSPQDPWEIIADQEMMLVCDSAVADKVVNMMAQVTEKGTGRSFYLPGFAAKTGTAQKADEEGNLAGLYTIWTTGGLTDDTTPYCVTVCLDNVSSDAGSSDAGKLAQSILNYMTGGE